MTLPVFRPDTEAADWIRILHHEREQEREAEVRRHYGPGPHPSGSSQDVHAGDRGGDDRSRRLEYDPETDQIVVIDEDNVSVEVDPEPEQEPGVNAQERERAISQVKNGLANEKYLEDFYGVERMGPEISPAEVKELFDALGLSEHDRDVWLEAVTAVSKNHGLENISVNLLVNELLAHYNNYDDIYQQMDVTGLVKAVPDRPIDFRGQRLDPEVEWTDPELSSELRKSLTDIADEIRQLPTEHAYVIDPDGKVVFDKTGTRDAVEFSDEEIKDAAGMNMIHNHPTGKGFSPEDVYFGLRNGLDRVIAVGPTGDRHVVRFSDHDRLTDDEFFEALSTVEMNVKSRFRELMDARRLSYLKAEQTHAHEVMLRLEEWYPRHLDYARELAE